jgi:hypothetical protein
MAVIPRLRAMSPVRTDAGDHFAGAGTGTLDASVAPRAVVVCSSRRDARKLTRRPSIGEGKSEVWRFCASVPCFRLSRLSLVSPSFALSSRLLEREPHEDGHA